MRYRKDHELIERRVHPLGLIAKRNVWYVAAEEESGELRTHRISRIEEAKLLQESFERPYEFKLAEYWEESTARFKALLPRYPARVKITELRLSRMKRERYAKVLRSEPDGRGYVTADIEFHTLESACEIILAGGREIIALDPPELCERVKSEAQAVLSMYSQK